MGCLCLYLTSLSATFTAGSNAQLDQTPVFLLCTTSVDNAMQETGRILLLPLLSPTQALCPSYVLLLCTRRQKKLSQFQAPGDSLLYLSLGIILTSFTSLACSPSLRSLALGVVTAAPYVTHAVTHHPLLTHASPAVPAKNIKIHRAFLCYLN